MKRARVVAAYAAAYPDPIRLRAGEAMVLTGAEDLWDGWRWLWARAPDGREGWVPDDLPRPGPVAARDYDARELSCEAGEVLPVEELRHGWARLRRGEATGWVPLRCLEAADPD
ncbi:SH3 domain-containing protein [Albimonas pacifica]|uniref:Variant SH3 domain-containing protein n=1 Tax=Albimonas pacifica TaxID=1114924 RepID=A0A1I3M9F4_9RHOB|nr:SH3 domain-containing protein [Albimonas pacifica]SFI93684.1 Variant SH3 domain-containing protein [Albimonas pacifica]